jgi:hypothetical protein
MRARSGNATAYNFVARAKISGHFSGILSSGPVFRPAEKFCA